MINLVVISTFAEKSLRKAPRHVVVNFAAWREQVKEAGLEVVQKIPGYHDEPLSGKLKGLRSIRLNGGYRAYYRLTKDSVEIEYVLVEEVNKHDYKKVERRFR